MKISKIYLNNFRIYRGRHQIDLSSKGDRNITIIAGKNGFGKTTFLTSLIWCCYGKLMSQVEDKYRRDIKNAGGYEKYVLSLMNRQAKKDFDNDNTDISVFSVEVELNDILIPSIPCRTVTIKRSFNIRTQEESLAILIDGYENELTKEVGFEVFINDFILPREIAKFFFFDAEKIVALAEAKSKVELRSLSKAYSEVLGIKKYEELRKNLESLLSKLKRRGATDVEKSRLDELRADEEELQKRIDHNQDKQDDTDKQIAILRAKSDNLQEKLIREGNAITLEELKALKSRREELKKESKEIKGKLKKLLDLAPLVIAGNHLSKLYQQAVAENDILYGVITMELLKKELRSFSNSVLANINSLVNDVATRQKLEATITNSLESKFKEGNSSGKAGKILLDFPEERFREFEATYSNIKTTYLSQFNTIVQEEKNNKVLLSKILYKIKQAEARKDNHLAKQFREEKMQTDQEITNLTAKKDLLIEEAGALKVKLASKSKVRVEYEKNFNLVEADKKKYKVTEKLLVKISEVIKKIKEDKKYALQKSIALGLRKLMHKDDFITDVRVTISDDVMDIDLLDKYRNIIDKDSLSKGEQQLYATALLKALIDESGN